MTVVDLEFGSVDLTVPKDIQFARESLLAEPDVDYVCWQLSDGRRYQETVGIIFENTGDWRLEDLRLTNIGQVGEAEIGDFIHSQCQDGRIIVGFQGITAGEDHPPHGFGDRKLSVANSNK